MTWKQKAICSFCAFFVLVACTDQQKTRAQHNSTQTAEVQQQQDQQVKIADSSQQFTAGKDYYLLNQPLEPETTEGVEVLEIFWFGCPHCYATQPYIKQWEETKPANATFIRMPAPLGGLWRLHARIFYTNQAMGLEEKLQQATFDAIHKNKLRMTSVDQFAEYYQEHFGVNAEEYKKTFSSFTVNLKLQKAETAIRQANIDGVPAFIVAGKYLVNGTSAGSTSRIFSVINYLVDLESQG